MFEKFDNKYGIVKKFFEELVTNENCSVPNSIILHGPDVIAQYYFAMNLARGANCIGDKSNNCECQNCRWIKSNEHPEIMTISKINSKPENDDSKTVISVKQIEQIKDKLVVSSDYHRFFIFCDAEIRDYNNVEKEKISEFHFLNQNMPKIEKGTWVPLGLTKNCFSDIVANALLKSVEEPPSSVTFVFLTENIENIISTIVSRSQAFYIPGNSKQNVDIDFLLEPLKNYPIIERKKAFLISDFLKNYSKNNDKSMFEIMTSIQKFLMELLKRNASDFALKKQIYEDINSLQNLMMMSKSGEKDHIVADEIGFILTK